MSKGNGHAPWDGSDEIDHDYGAKLLDSVSVFLGRFIAYPSPHAHVAHVLWIAHTHLMELWESTPRLAFLSPEPGSGKTRALEITELLVPRAVSSINSSVAYLFRKISDPEGPPTLLYDEIDAVYGPKAKEHEDLRGFMNAGHRKGAMAGRCIVKGKTVETEEFPAYCALAMAGLGALPDSLFSRTISVRMQRRLPSEIIEPYRPRLHAAEGHALRDQLAAWAKAIAPLMAGTWPLMPDGITDRNADCWEPLLACADTAGETWATRARVTAVTLVTLSQGNRDSLGIRLLTDLRTVFSDTEVLSTHDILEALKGIEEGPWIEIYKGTPINARGLANLLKPHGVHSTTVRTEAGLVAKGYKRADLHDVWLRYLPKPLSLSPQESVTSVTSVTPEPVISSINPVCAKHGMSHCPEWECVT